MDEERRRQIEEEERYRLEVRKRLAAEADAAPPTVPGDATVADVPVQEGRSQAEPPPTEEVPSPWRGILGALAVVIVAAVVVAGVVAYEGSQPESVTSLVAKRWDDDGTILKAHCTRKGLVNVAGTSTTWYHCSDIANDGDFARINGDLYNVTREVEAVQALGGNP